MIRPIVYALATLPMLFGGAVAQEPEALEQRAIEAFSVAFGAPCEWAFNEDGSLRELPVRFTFEETPEYGDPYTLTLFQFQCNIGAYNTQQVYFVDSDFWGLTPVGFAVPTFEATFENDDDENGALLDLAVTGMSSQTILVNSEVDKKTGTISAVSYWRGLGDASSDGTWVRKDGTFVLQRYLIDPSYDGEVNPVVAVEYE
jgi:hypothetical protein